MPRTKQAVVAEFRCAEILDAARRVFARRGFSETTVDEIAEAAGVAKGTLYLYFESKRQIYLSAMQQGLDRLFEETGRRMSECATARDKLRAFVDTRIRYFEQDRDFFKIYHFELSSTLLHPAQAGKQFHAFYLRQAAALSEVLRQAVAAGEIRDVRTELAAFAIYDMTRGVITQRLLGWSGASMEEDIEFLFQMIWRGLEVR